MSQTGPTHFGPQPEWARLKWAGLARFPAIVLPIVYVDLKIQSPSSHLLVVESYKLFSLNKWPIENVGTCPKKKNHFNVDREERTSRGYSILYQNVCFNNHF